MRAFDVVIERDEEGFYVASIPALPGCHTQGFGVVRMKGRLSFAMGRAASEAAYLAVPH
jgi:hypothetical protein